MLCTLAMVLLVGLQAGTQGLAFLGAGGGSEDAAVEGGGGPALTVIGQARRVGARIWGERVELPQEGGRVALGLRIHNSGSTTITNVSARMPVPDRLSLVPGSCRFGVDAVAEQPCQGALAGEGTVVAELGAESWLHLVALGEVLAEASGGSLPALASIGSDQTSEQHAEVEIVVSPTRAEEVVRELYREARQAEFLHEVEKMAARSKRLMIDRWPEFAPDRSHDFGAMAIGPSVGLLQLYYDRRLSGRVVKFHAEVLSRPWEFPAPQGRVEQSMQVGWEGGATTGWCYTVRSTRHLLHSGDRIEVKAIPIGWGGLESADGPVPVTLLACAAIRRIG